MVFFASQLDRPTMFISSNFFLFLLMQIQYKTTAFKRKFMKRKTRQNRKNVKTWEKKIRGKTYLAHGRDTRKTNKNEK